MQYEKNKYNCTCPLYSNNQVKTDETYYNNFGADVSFYTSNALDQTYGTSFATTNNHVGVVTSTPSIFNNSLITSNNSEFAVVDKSKGDDRVTVYARPVGGGIANHLFVVVDQRKDGKPDIIFSLGDNGNFLNLSEQGIPIVEVLEVDKVSTQAQYSTIQTDTQSYLNNTYVEQQIINVPEGMTQYQLDELVLKNAQSYDINKNLYPTLPQTIKAGIDAHYGGINNVFSDYRNSNTYIDNVIEQSGGWIKNFYNAPLQNAGEYNEKINSANKGNE